MKNIVIASPTSMEMATVNSFSGLEKIVLGVGPVSAAINLVHFLEHNRPELLLLIGICGAYPDRSVDIGDCLVADKEIFGDFGRCGGDDIVPIDIVGEEIESEFDLQQSLEGSAYCYMLPFLRDTNRLISGTFVTVCCSSMSRERACLLSRKWDAHAENMEGAAVCQVCQMYSLPVIEIRSVSNIVGEPRDKWDISGALSVLEKEVTYLLRSISEKDCSHETAP